MCMARLTYISDFRILMVSKNSWEVQTQACCNRSPQDTLKNILFQRFMYSEFAVAM